VSLLQQGDAETRIFDLSQATGPIHPGVAAGTVPKKDEQTERGTFGGHRNDWGT
jgi:hypothetical protein